MPLAQWGDAVVSVRQRRSRSEGFTLLELMIVVTIIAVSAALAAPAITQAMSIARADRANHDVVRLVRQGRSEAMAYGRAYLLHVDRTGNGRVELWRGASSACRLENWGTTMGAGPCASPATPGGNCVDYVDSLLYVVGGDGVTFSMPGTLYDVCFQPNGDALVRTPGATGPFMDPPLGSIEIDTTRFDSVGGTPDPQRGCLIPSAGAPRVLR
jgi:prepilin-type N-terminal cleavage/methylation domain-containing protein